MRNSIRAALCSLVLAHAFVPVAAFAQSDASPEDRATARKLAQDGQAALDKKDYATAADRFSRADSLFHAPTILIGLARAEAGRRHFVGAQEAYNRVIREGVPANASPSFKKAFDDAKQEVGAIEGRIAWVTITITGPAKPVVKVDGVAFPAAALGVKRAVDPGDHTVSASGDGFAAKDTKFTVQEGGNSSVSLALDKAADGAASSTTPPPDGQPPPTDAPKSSSRKTIGFVALGVGVVGVGVGAITGILALGKHKTLAGECPNDCPSSAQSDLSSFHTMGAISTVGFIVGGVGLAAGAVLVVTAPKDQASAKAARATISPFIGAGTAGATGTFW